MTINDLAHVWSNLPEAVKKFTIGRGKRPYFRFKPTPNGFYVCHAVDENNFLSWPRYIKAGQQVSLYMPDGIKCVLGRCTSCDSFSQLDYHGGTCKYCRDE
jgi:hypothetical protein